MRPRVWFWVGQLLGYAILFLAVWLWLGIPERSKWDLLLSLFLGVGIVFGAALLVAQAFGTGGKPALAFILCLLLLGTTALWLGGYSAPIAAWLAAKASYWRGRPMNPAWFATGYRAFLWAVVAATAFALLSRLAFGNWRVAQRWKYWAACTLFVAVVMVVPLQLVRWVPSFGSFAAQTASLVVRFSLAYLMAVGALVAFASTVRSFARTAAVRRQPQPAANGSA